MIQEPRDHLEPDPDKDWLPVEVTGVDAAPQVTGQSGQAIHIHASQGDIPCFLHPAPGQEAVMWLPGGKGDYNGPGSGIYHALAEELVSQGITSLRLRYRLLHPAIIDEALLDALAAVVFLKNRGIKRVVLVGHSFGTTVAILAAPFSANVVAVAGMSGQNVAFMNVAQVAPRPLLLIHGLNDTHLPPAGSKVLYDLANKPKELVLLNGGSHSLNEHAQELRTLLRDWLQRVL